MTSFISFYQYLQKYIQKKLGNNKLSKNAANFVFINECIKPYDSRLTGKTQKQIHYINLYETYAKLCLGIYNIKTTYDEYIDSLCEGLIQTYPYEIITNKFTTQTGVSESNIEYMFNNNAKTSILLIELYYNEYITNKDRIEQFINTCGYFISKVDILKDVNEVILLIEPKFITEVTSSKFNDNDDLIYDKENTHVKNKCNGILYHITLGARYNKILNNGLIPKAHNKNSNHPERIYLYPSNYIPYDTKLSLKQHAKILYDKNMYKQYVTDKGLEICVLKIDLYKYQNLKYRFFYDPNHPLGVFTYEPIHPICVELFDTFYI